MSDNKDDNMIIDDIIDHEKIKKQNAQFIDDKINALRHDSNAIIFPEQSKQLSAIECATFFSTLNQHINKRKLNLNRLTLSPCTLEALEGLMAFLKEDHAKLRFSDIIIDIPDSLSVQSDAYNKTFNELLKQLTFTPVKRVTLLDPKAYLNDTDWEDTQKNIGKSELLYPEIILSKDRQTNDLKKETNKRQRHIDEVMDVNHWKNRTVKPLLEDHPDDKKSLEEEEVKNP